MVVNGVDNVRGVWRKGLRTGTFSKVATTWQTTVFHPYRMSIMGTP